MRDAGRFLTRRAQQRRGRVRARERAEQETAAAIERLAPDGFSAFHDVPRRRHTVDHALIGPDGAFALDSRWMDDEVRVTAGGIDLLTPSGHRQMPWLLGRARRGARDLRRVLRSVLGPVHTDVLPVLVLWGQVERIDGGACWVDDVLVANGAQGSEWMPALQYVALRQDEVERARHALAARKREHPQAA